LLKTEADYAIVAQWRVRKKGGAEEGTEREMEPFHAILQNTSRPLTMGSENYGKKPLASGPNHSLYSKKPVFVP
jgi:hypothetical protein